tara:strand:+ start:274 stop:543 length:270 start_codon:yes stop_codon:yes gene_type:complete
LREYSNAWQKHATRADPHHETLCQDYLPVLFADTGHHHSKDGCNGADDDKSPEMASIEYWASEQAAKEKQQERLDRPDPGYPRGCFFFE